MTRKKVQRVREFGYGFLSFSKTGQDISKTGQEERPRIFMMRCYQCGKENYMPAVASGRCAWCGYDANGDEALMAEFLLLDLHTQKDGYKREIVS